MAFSFLLITVSWAMSNPLGSAPDEAIQGATAYSTAHGQLATLHPSVPPTYAKLADHDALFCFQKSWDTSAACQNWSVISGPNAPMFSQFGSYNPVYYFLVGWPTRFLEGRAAIYAMRLVSATIVSLVLAAAVTIAWAYRPRRAAAVGPLLALAPTVLFLASAINPNALEIAAAVLAWSGLLVLLSTSENRRSTAFRLSVSLTTLGLSLLLVTRLMSPLWAAVLVVATVTAMRRWRAFGRLVISSVRFQVHMGLLTIPAGWALGWSLTHPTVFSGGGGVGDYADSLAQWLQLTVEEIFIGFPSQTFGQIVAVLGWTSFGMDLVTFAFAVLWGGLMVAAVAGTDSQPARWTVVLLAVFCVVFPAALAAYMWSGKGWQGRYILPVAVGLPILCTRLIVDTVMKAGRGELPLRRALRAAVVLVFTVQLTAFVFYYKRNAVGWNHSWNPVDFTWSAPLGPWIWLTLVTLGSVMMCWLAWAATRKPASAVHHSPNPTVPFPKG